MSAWLAWIVLRCAASAAGDGLVLLADVAPQPAALRPVVDLADASAVVYDAPRRDRMVGLLGRGGMHEVLDVAAGPDCPAGWLRVGPAAWICGSGHAVRQDRPRAAPWPPAPERWAPLPFLYVHPLGHGRLLYDNPPDALDRTRGTPFPPGTWESVDASFRRGGVALYRTVAGSYLRADDVRPAAPSSLVGFFPDPSGAPWRYGFVAADVAEVWAEPPPRPRWATARSTHEHLPRYALVPIDGEGDGWVRIGQERYLQRATVRVFRPQPRPAGVALDERWFDVNLAEQVFAAYAGDEPRFVTLASAGKGTLTREGSFRIYRTAGTQTMRGIPLGGDRRTYEVRDVPWVMFFDEDRAIHAAFWHDEFGTARSHGCINLAPAAARWAFDFVRPALPDGWLALEPADPSRGTLVHIHR